MQLRETLQSGLKTLLEHHVPSAQLAAELLLMHLLACDRGFLYAHPEKEVPQETIDRYFDLIAERATGKPTQYITGHQEFWGLDFVVTPDVLIPRPETEHVVETVLDILERRGCPKDARLHIVDVGTGSGCIALALASELPRAILFGVDISRMALVVASENALRLGMPERIKFLEGDLLGRFLDDDFLGTFDFVVSNPPYVSRDELDKVQREVRDFEPRVALGDLETGDEIYRRLFPQALRVLKPGGHVVVEIGYNMRDAVVSLLGHDVAPGFGPAGDGADLKVGATSAWTDIEVKADLRGIPRVVSARKKRESEVRSQKSE
ncbi:MAG: peptide chain release factor N(5)-glutamine methyltransferase [Acidobacteriia bacterium]|nr:peptide chain release factor N(5)-glutamine methyltransferase [Terriglobia bacterium]